MISEINKDPILLGKKAAAAGPEDSQTAVDLLDTLMANADHCVGMAANMIGRPVAIIAFFDGDKPMVMYNPEIISCSQPYTAEEGCLSLSGVRTARRYKKIKVSFYNSDFQKRLRTFTDFTAQVIQHEVDHCNGILI